MRDDTMLQIADVIVAEHNDEASGAEWAGLTLDRYPGCCAAVSIGIDQNWVLIRIRGEA
ncbi:MAG: hypothetical protein ABW224_19755 [Kibdelosporangium sp.]